MKEMRKIQKKSALAGPNVNTIKKFSSPKLIYRFTTISIKILITFYTEIVKNNSKTYID